MNLFNKISSLFAQNPSSFWPEIISTLLILVSSVAIVLISKLLIKKQDLPSIQKRKYGVFVRNFIVIVSIIFLFFTWRGEIKAFIFSVSAITAGLLVAFKEVILSFFAYFVISSNQLFKVGDMVEIDDKVGRVIDKSLVYTRIALLGPNKDKEIVIPNIFFVTNKFVNLSSTITQSKAINVVTDSELLEEKTNFLIENMKPFGYEFITAYVEFTTRYEIVIRLVVQLSSQAQDFNLAKNTTLNKFLQQFPPKVLEGIART